MRGWAADYGRPWQIMICPHCDSSRVRRSKRSVAEKAFLPMLLLRPFRCEDCISRYFTWIWRSASEAAPASGTRRQSLVYQSPAAALHSTVRPSRKLRRKSNPGTAQDGLPQRLAFSLRSWLSEPIQAPKHPANVAPAAASQPATATPKAEFFPEILGVILEIKH